MTNHLICGLEKKKKDINEKKIYGGNEDLSRTRARGRVKAEAKRSR